jgi:uncharacterized protein YndB with AHSA1/START domain
MITVERQATIAAPPDRVWSVLADFPGISRWAPDVDHSCAMTDRHDGLGAVRRVQTGRTTLVETVREWEPGSRLAYGITGLPPVVRSVVTSWTLEGVGSPAVRTEVTVRTDVDAGPRPPQRLIAKVVARKFGSAADEMLAGLTAHVERSTTR